MFGIFALAMASFPNLFGAWAASHVVQLPDPLSKMHVIDHSDEPENGDGEDGIESAS